MYLVLVHDALYLADLGAWQHKFRRSCHNIAYCMVEEFGLPAFHGTANVTVCNESYHLMVVGQGHTEAELTFADADNRFAQVHLLRDNRQVVGAHHVGRGGQKPLPKLATRVELREVLRTEVAHLHQSNRQSIAHSQRSGCAACRSKV